MHDALRETAVAACEAAGELALDAFRDGTVAGEYSALDAKTDLDVAAEARMLDVIEDSFPDHAILAEESGRHDGDGYEWVVDPLDGTNNVAAGLPVFAHAVAVRDDDGTLFAVVHEPLTRDTYVAERGVGATVNGDPIAAGSDLPLSAATVSLVPGLDALRDPDRAGVVDALDDALGEACKRTLATWAPCVDWGLLARGGIEAVVTFHPDAWEQHAGTLLAREAGASAWRDGPLAVHAANDRLRDALRDVVAPVP